MLWYIIALEVGLESAWQLNRTQVSFVSGHFFFTIVIIVSASYFGIERLDIDSARVARHLFSRVRIETENPSIVQIMPKQV